MSDEPIYTATPSSSPGNSGRIKALLEDPSNYKTSVSYEEFKDFINLLELDEGLNESIAKWWWSWMNPPKRPIVFAPRKQGQSELRRKNFEWRAIIDEWAEAFPETDINLSRVNDPAYINSIKQHILDGVVQLPMDETLLERRCDDT